MRTRTWLRYSFPSHRGHGDTVWVLWVPGCVAAARGPQDRPSSLLFLAPEQAEGFCFHSLGSELCFPQPGCRRPGMGPAGSPALC